MLHRCHDDFQGKYALLLGCEGRVADPDEPGSELDLWLVNVVGGGIAQDDRPCHQFVVAERYLRLLGQLDQDELDDVLRQQAMGRLDEPLALIKRKAALQPLSPELRMELEVQQAAKSEVEKALEVLPTEQLLLEMGFMAEPPDSTVCFEWSASCRGIPIKVLAGPDIIRSTWTITGTCVTDRSAMWDERQVLVEEARGKLALLILTFWRNAFGRFTPVPERLSSALAFELHQRERSSSLIVVPYLTLDGEVFRASRRWLAEWHALKLKRSPTEPPTVLRLKFDGQLLHLVVDDHHFTCPARGVGFGDEFSVSLGSLLKTPYHQLRGRELKLLRYSETIALQGHDMQLLRPEQTGLT